MGATSLRWGSISALYSLSSYESFTADDNFGSYFFNGSFSGNDFADFLLGLPFHDAIAQRRTGF